MNWHEKKMVDGVVKAFGTKCRCCWQLWFNNTEIGDMPWDQWCSECRSDSTTNARIDSAAANLPADDKRYVSGSLYNDDSETLCIQRHLIGMNHSEFKAKYSVSPEDAGVKVQSLPGLKPGTTFRGVLLMDPACPGLRYTLSRASATICSKCCEKDVFASVATGLYTQEINDEKANKAKDMIYTKMRTCQYTHTQLLEDLRTAGVKVTPSMAQWASGEAGQGRGESDEDDTDRDAESDGQKEAAAAHAKPADVTPPNKRAGGRRGDRPASPAPASGAESVFSVATQPANATAKWLRRGSRDGSPSVSTCAGKRPLNEDCYSLFAKLVFFDPRVSFTLSFNEACEFGSSSNRKLKCVHGGPSLAPSCFTCPPSSHPMALRELLWVPWPSLAPWGFLSACLGLTVVSVGLDDSANPNSDYFATKAVRQEEKVSYHLEKIDIVQILLGAALGTPMRWARQEAEELTAAGSKQHAQRIEDHLDVASVAQKLADKKNAAR